MRRVYFIGPLVAALAVGGYAAAFARYGVFDFADEGVLLAQALRVAQGQVPYVDFQTGYGPLYFRLEALLHDAGGMAAIRAALVLVHAASGALVYALTRRVAGSALAAAAVCLQIAFLLPIAPAKGAPFNVPYPSWYTGVAALGTALLVRAGRGGPRPLGAFAAGLLAGMAFAMKPNSGLLLAAGAAVAIVLGGPPHGRAGVVGWAVLVLAVVAPTLLVAPTGLTVAAVVLVPPMVGCATLGGSRGASDRHVVPRLLLLAVGFFFVAMLWYAPPLAVLGRERFLREAMQVGAGMAGVYGSPLPPIAALAALIGLFAYVAAGRRAVRWSAAAAAAVVALAVAMGAAGEASAGTALRRGAEDGAFALLPVVLWGAIGALHADGPVELVAPTALAAAGALQLYPRADFLHLLSVGPLLLPIGLWLWRRAAEMVAAAPRAGLLAVGVPLALAAVRFVPAAGVLGEVATGRVEHVAFGGEDELVIAPDGAPALRSLGAAVAAVRERTSPDETVITFPACAIVPALAERLPAGSYDYFFPGLLDRGEAAVQALQLASAAPHLAVTCSAGGTDLARAWDSYPEFAGFIAARYKPLLVLPPFVVHERQD